jgi:TonB family protein
MKKFWLIWLLLLYVWQLHAQHETAKDSIYTIADQMPEPQDGYKNFYKYLQENLFYTQEALEKKIQGYVFVQFVVNTEGKLEDIKVIKGLGYGLDEEALRVFSESPPWHCGWHQGKKVKVRMTFNVVFRLPP